MKKQEVVMITGASKGLGRALTLAFAKQGYGLAICARGKEALEAVKEEALQVGARAVIAVQADGAVEEDVDRFVSVTEATLGRIDVLINNASVFGPGPVLLADYESKAFQEVLVTNVLHPFLMTKRVLPGMLTRQEGRIIHITSEAGVTGFAEWGAYGVSKFALEGLFQTWVDELEGTSVYMNLVDPGEMDTDMHERAVPACDYPLAKPEDIVEVFLKLATAPVNGKRLQAQTANDGQEVL